MNVHLLFLHLWNIDHQSPMCVHCSFIILLNNITDMSHIVSRVTLLAKSGIQEVVQCIMSLIMMAMHCQTMKNEISDTKANKGQVSSKQGSHDLSLISLMSDPVCSLSTPVSLWKQEKQKECSSGKTVPAWSTIGCQHSLQTPLKSSGNFSPYASLLSDPVPEGCLLIPPFFNTHFVICASSYP